MALRAAAVVCLEVIFRDFNFQLSSFLQID